MEKVSESSYITYHNHRSEPYFTYVKEGLKTIEGRVRKGWYKHIKAGDHITIYNDEEMDSVEVVVLGVRTYASVREMLQHEVIQKLLPDATTIEQGLEIYKRFYTPEQEREFGVVAIEITRLTS